MRRRQFRRTIEESAMPRTDPARSSESATRHLFRHFLDEQELLRNPYVGPALAAGRLTMAELRARLAAAARSIEAEDRASGNHWRGVRQAAALIECTLKRRAPHEVAAEFGISARQLFRERQAAWTRAVRYLASVEPAGPSGAVFADVQCNQAAQLFYAGKREAGDALLRQMIAAATGVERFMLAALAAELHQTIGDASFLEMRATARSLYGDACVQGSALCRLTMMLLEARFDAQIADALGPEPGVKWWMIRVAIRLLIAQYRRAVATCDRRAALRIADAAIRLGRRVPTLPEIEQFNLRLLTARVDWMVRGWSPRAEAALIGNYQTASANGWLAEVVQCGGLLASMMIIAGKSGSEDYAQTVLAVAKTLPDGKTAGFTYLNFAVAELDAGRPDDAAALLAGVMPFPATSADERGMDELQAEYDLLAREVRVAQSPSAASPPLSGRRTNQAAAQDPVRAAYRSRVAALELEHRHDHREAVRQISEAWEIAAHAGDWMAHRTIGRTYHDFTARRRAGR